MFDGLFMLYYLYKKRWWKERKCVDDMPKILGK